MWKQPRLSADMRRRIFGFLPGRTVLYWTDRQKDEEEGRDEGASKTDEGEDIS